jgi:hypothetical protein
MRALAKFGIIFFCATTGASHYIIGKSLNRARFRARFISVLRPTIVAYNMQKHSSEVQEENSAGHGSPLKPSSVHHSYREFPHSLNGFCNCLPLYYRMVIGRITRRSALRSLALSRQQVCQTKARGFYTSTAAGSSPATASPASVLGSLTSELDRIAPRFDVHASQVRILQTPTEFYDTLKVGGTNGLLRLVVKQPTEV